MSKQSKFSKSNKQRSYQSAFLGKISTVYVRVQSFTVAQSSAAASGGLTSAQGAGSQSLTNSTHLSPYTLGGSFQNIAAYFQQYRIKRARFIYVPYCTPTGFVDDVTGGTASSSAIIASREFAMVYTQDPATLINTFNLIVDTGGVAGNTVRRMVLPVKPSPWLYASTAASFSTPPSGSDLREAAFGRLGFAYRNNSSTASRTYGEVEFEGIVEFRYPISPLAVIGTALSAPIADQKQSKSDSKDNTTEDLNALTSSELGNSFMLIRKKK